MRFLEIEMRFHFLQIPVYIHPTFWLFLLFFTDIYRDFSMKSALMGVVLLFSLLVHEYGHALTARYFGARPEITLEAFGGNVQYNGFRMKRWQQFVITLNGPLLESILILLSYLLLVGGAFAGNYYMRYFLSATFHLNILWCALNLLPISPLDGGRMLSYLLEGLSRRQGEKITLLVGLVTVVLVAPLLYARGLFFFGTLLLIFGFQHVQRLQEVY